MPKADQILRKFILDPAARERILLAWLHDDVTMDNGVTPPTTEEDKPADGEENSADENTAAEATEETTEPEFDHIRISIRNILHSTSVWQNRCALRKKSSTACSTC